MDRKLCYLLALEFIENINRKVYLLVKHTRQVPYLLRDAACDVTLELEDHRSGLRFVSNQKENLAMHWSAYS